MALQNGWVGYLERSYTQIKQSLISRLVTKTPEITDHTESNLLILVISMFAGLTEQLNYYVDNMARESFITTARRYSSAIKLVKLIDYRIKASIPAAVDLTINFTNSGTPFPLPSNFTIAPGTLFKTTNGIIFMSTSSVTILAGATSGLIPCRQQEIVSSDNLGTTIGVASEQVPLPVNYADSSLTITVGGDVSWELKDTLGRSGPTDKHYIVEIGLSKTPYIKFGDGVNGLQVPGSQVILADYLVTEGSGGNALSSTITNIITALTVPGGPTTTILNNFDAVGGLDVESLASIAKRAPLSIRTLDRAVTKKDYEDISVLAPGVSKATVFFECGKTIDIYISPEGGGIAQIALLNTTKNYVDQRKMVTTFVNVRPAGESIIKITLEATARFRMNGVLTLQDIENALLDLYSIENSDVNKKIRKSDIIATVDNLAKVDFLKLTGLSLLPYPRPSNHTTQLIWSPEVLIGSTARNVWRINYDGVNFNVFKSGQYIGSTLVGVPFTDIDNIIQFTISAGPYIGGQDWDFITYPINEDIELDDFSLPITNNGNLFITVNEQLVTNN